MQKGGGHSSFFTASPHKHVDRVEFTNFRDALLARRDRIREVRTSGKRNNSCIAARAARENEVEVKVTY